MYKRSLFEFELFPVLRSARMAWYLFNCAFNGGFKIDTLSNRHLNKIFENVLIAEGENSARYSELLGTFDCNKPSRKYLSGNYSIINKEPLLRSFEHFWEISGANVVCKQKSRREFAIFARDFHPYCFISLWLWDKLNTPLFSKPLLNRIVLNLDHIGISCDKTPKYSENHIHITGAYPSLECILDCIEGRSSSKEGQFPPDVDRDITLWGSASALLNLFGNCARFLIWKHISQHTAPNKRSRKPKELRDIYESQNPDQNEYSRKSKELMRNIYESGHLTNKILNAYSLSSLKKAGGCTDFPLSESVKYFSEQNEASFFYFLMFLWEKIFGDDANSEDSPIALMLINQINLIRSYAVMSACNGLEFFTKYFSSPVRNMDSGKRLTRGLRCTLNSGIKNLQFRTGLKNPETDIPAIFRRTKNEINKFCDGRDIDRNSVKFSIVYHYNKSSRQKAKNFIEKKKRKALDSLCNDFIKFAGSSKSLISAESRIEKMQTTGCGNSRANIDLMRVITGVDAAGNEESVPPEVYAPYLRRLAAMREAQKIRADKIKDMPELNPLKKLFHSGEDFEDIITGLRRMDETVNFLCYGENDRISHALALGVNPHKWYSGKSAIRISKINYLDNLVWLHAQVTKSGLPEFLPLAIWCEKLAIKIARELYDGITESKRLENININVLLDAWKLRRNCPITWNRILNKNGIEQIRNTNKFELIPDIDKKFNGENLGLESELFQYYNNNQNFFKKANECIYLKNDGEVLWDGTFNEEIDLKTYTNAVYAVQDLKINEYAEKGIILEVCPSSNIYIGNLSSVEEHPVFRWNPPIRSWLNNKFNKSKIRKNVINVCINTDDPAVFPTNMENEFRLLKLGAENLMDDSDDIKDIEDWINSLKEYNEKVFFDTYKSIHMNIK